MLFPFLIGTTLGLLAGWFGGWFDLVLMRLVDMVVAFPSFVLIIALVFVLGQGTSSIYIAITLVGWVAYARIVRGEVLVAKEQEYALAARASGLPTWRILLRHLLPNVLLQAFVFAMSDVVLSILAIVTLGYLGPRRAAAHPRLGLDDRGGPGLRVHQVVPDRRARPGRRRHRPRRSRSSPTASCSGAGADDRVAAGAARARSSTAAAGAARPRRRDPARRRHAARRPRGLAHRVRRAGRRAGRRVRARARA